MKSTRISQCIDSCIENKNKIVLRRHSFSEFCIIIGYGKNAENDRITSLPPFWLKR